MTTDKTDAITEAKTRLGVAIAIRMLRNPSGGITIIDFKAPKPDILEDYAENGISIDYVAQLHHIRSIAVDRGMQVNGMMNVFFDYEGRLGATMPEKMENAFNAVAIRVHYDPDLEATLIAAGEQYWNEYVMQGRVPDYAKKPKFSAGALTQEIINASRRATKAKMIADSFKKIADQEQDRIKEYVEDLGQLGDARVYFSGLELSASTQFDLEAVTEKFGAMSGPIEAVTEPGGIDTEALVAQLRADGYDLSKFERRSAPDPAKMVSWMDAQGIDTTRMVRETMKMKMPTVKSGRVFDAMKEIKSQIERRTSDIMAMIDIKELEDRVGFAPEVLATEPAPNQADTADKTSEAPVPESSRLGALFDAQDEEAEHASQLRMGL